MTLTSGRVLVLAVVLAVLLFAGTVWFWPRLAGRSVRVVLARIGLLLLTQVTIFASLGLAANRSFGFYASWADLFGQEREPGVVVDHDRGGAPLEVTGTRTVNVPGGARPSQGGQIQRVRIEGRRSGLAAPAYVYVPPEYFRPGGKQRTFRAAMVLTGYPGTARALFKGLQYPQTAHSLVRKGRMQPMLLVMMRPTVAPPRDTECVDVPGGPRSETFLSSDVPEAVAGHYRVGTGRGQWGVIGNSTGGYCALKFALHHPARFGAGAGLSAEYRAPSDPTTGDLFHGDRRLEQRADLLWFLDHEPPPPVSLLVASSRHGEGNYRATQRFIGKVRAPARVSSITLGSGGHNFNTWRREIPAALEWLSGRLR
ncbi:putative esterase [Streptomyces sp. YIM 130001]|uniref:alpha/beta hydrolase n=1 Tax=Streptomyces sp. YIM 130001 TaxID=2259644 RepID=UPI000E651BE9|nr:alpha/beta hydrolase-fold protein [Streptomyces sp. YIM 130001]RII12459.1 putative esterase [Streptomyces sp. YIM 130001]